MIQTIVLSRKQIPERKKEFKIRYRTADGEPL